MTDIFKNIIVSLFLGFLCAFISESIHSIYLPIFLNNNLLILLIAVLAINTTTVTVLIDKIGRIQLDNPRTSFEPTRQEIHKSIVEQIVLISIAIIILILSNSNYVEANTQLDISSTAILTAILIYDIMILWDSVNAVFVIDSYYNKK